MRPTVGEQLAGIDRLLEIVAADPSLEASSTAYLADARKQLSRLTGSVDAREDFLRWDTDAALAVLATVNPALAERFVQSAQSTADEANVQIRSLLVEALDALGPDREGAEARGLIAQHLRARVDANPSLNKQPRR